MVELRFNPRAVLSRAYALKYLAASPCVQVGRGKTLHREETAQAKAKRPPKTHSVLAKGVTSPLGKEGGIRGQTEKGCLSSADTWLPWGAVQPQGHRLTED